MVRVSRAARFPIGAALGTSNLGRLAARDGRFAEAHELLDEAAAAFAEIDAEPPRERDARAPGRVPRP